MHRMMTDYHTGDQLLINFDHVVLCEQGENYTRVYFLNLPCKEVKETVKEIWSET